MEQTLSDDAGLEMTMVGAGFASDLLAIEIAFVVEMLVAGTPGNGRHGLHPKMIPISADGMDGLFEGDFDFEAHAIKGDVLKDRAAEGVSLSSASSREKAWPSVFHTNRVSRVSPSYSLRSLSEPDQGVSDAFNRGNLVAALRCVPVFTRS